MQEIVLGGLYRHFKGMLYYVIDIAIHSETDERSCGVTTVVW